MVGRALTSSIRKGTVSDAAIVSGLDYIKRMIDAVVTGDPMTAALEITPEAERSAEVNEGMESLIEAGRDAGFPFTHVIDSALLEDSNL